MKPTQCMNTIRKIIDFFLLASIVILFLLMFGFTNANVFSRYILNSPIIISNEIARYAYVDMIFIGAIFTMREDKHLSLDFFVDRMPRTLSFVVKTLGRFLMEIFLLIFVRYAIQMTITNLHIPSTAMQIPMAIPYCPLVIGGIGMILEEANLIVVNFKNYKQHTLPKDLEAKAEEETA